jgi:hypothetical protein
MRADHHNSHRRSTATGGTNERAVSVALVLLALWEWGNLFQPVIVTLR